MIDPLQHGFRRDRFNIGYVSPLGVTVSYDEACRIIELEMETKEAMGKTDTTRRQMLKNGFAQLREAVS